MVISIVRIRRRHGKNQAYMAPFRHFQPVFRALTRNNDSKRPFAPPTKEVFAPLARTIPGFSVGLTNQEYNLAVFKELKYSKVDLQQILKVALKSKIPTRNHYNKL